MEKLKILVLSPSYPRSESDSRVPFVRAMFKEIAKEAEVTVVTSSAPDTKNKFHEMDSIKIHRFDYFFPRKLQKLSYTDSGGIMESFKRSFFAKIQMPFFILSFFFKAFKHAKHCDVIDAQWLLSGLVAIPLKWIYKKPIVCVVRGAALRSMPTFIRKFVVKRVDVFVAWTPELQAMLHKLGRKDGIVDIKQMINFEKLKTPSDLPGFKKEFGIRDEKIVTFLGRMVYMKDPAGFVKAIPYVLKQKKDVKFLMVGDGELRPEVEKLITELKIEKNVIVTGNRPDINNVLNVSDIFVGLSPIAHTYSATIMEAMFLGVPVILDDPPYTKEGFGDSVYIVEEDNPEQLARAMVEVLGDKGLYNKLSDNGPRFVKELGFDKETIVKKTMELYERVIEQGKR